MKDFEPGPWEGERGRILRITEEEEDDDGGVVGVSEGGDVVRGGDEPVETEVAR